MRKELGRIFSATLAVLVLVLSSLAQVSSAKALPRGSERIIGGSEASIDDVPWQVGLLYRDKGPDLYDAQYCGGSLINPSWIVTAAHCVVGKRASKVAIVAGVDHLQLPRGTNELPLNSMIVHPDYVDWFNDIALLRVKGRFDVNDISISPISLPLNIDGDLEPSVGTEIIVSGWGEQEAYEKANYPTFLRKTILEVIANSSSDICGDYQPGSWNVLYEICVGVDDGASDTCQGDSGGPYVAENLDGDGDGINEPTLVGVTSWGKGCADSRFPGLATRVSAYVDLMIPNPPVVTTRFTSGNGTHRVSWTPSVNQFVSAPVSGYRVEYSTNGGEDWAVAAIVTKSTRTISQKRAPNVLWRVAALNEVNKNFGPYLWANNAGPMETRGLAAPDAPTEVNVWDYGRARLVFEWEQPEAIHGSAIWEYRVYRVRPGEVSQLVGRARNTDYTTIVSTLDRKTGLVFPISDYYIVAVNNAGESIPSNLVRGYSSGK